MWKLGAWCKLVRFSNETHKQSGNCGLDASYWNSIMTTRFSRWQQDLLVDDEKIFLLRIKSDLICNEIFSLTTRFSRWQRWQEDLLDNEKISLQIRSDLLLNEKIFSSSTRRSVGQRENLVADQIRFIWLTGRFSPCLGERIWQYMHVLELNGMLVAISLAWLGRTSWDIVEH